jgi:hypothetical protein
MDALIVAFREIGVNAFREKERTAMNEAWEVPGIADW